MNINKLVLLRHGESEWNLENRFTGWTDVGLTEKGKEEARQAGIALKKEGFVFDSVYCSVLKRAVQTADITLMAMGLSGIAFYKSWRLNERHYGALQGLYKKATAQKLGEEQVRIWRRSYEVRPPLVEKSDPRYPGNDLLYKDIPAEELPFGESLKDTVERLLPYWETEIKPAVVSGKKVLVCAHGNSIRALVKYLDKIGDNEISGVQIPTGIPLVYELSGMAEPLKKYFIGDPEKVKAAMDKVANQGRKT